MPMGKCIIATNPFLTAATYFYRLAAFNNKDVESELSYPLEGNKLAESCFSQYSG